MARTFRPPVKGLDRLLARTRTTVKPDRRGARSLDLVNPTLTLGRVAGIRIGINWSWLIVFGLIVWTLGANVFPAEDPHLSTRTYTAMAVAAALLFFTSLLLHELGHALQARREGVEIEGITLWLLGGVASFKGMFPSASAELRIALAGPAVSAALGGIFVAIAAAIDRPVAVDGVAAWLGYINLLLLGFNMLPALPLDGGRVFRSLLWRWRRDFASATRIAAQVGRGFAYALMVLGLAVIVLGNSWSGAWLAFIGWFLLQAAGMEARSLVLRDALGGLRVRDLMVGEPITATADSTLAAFMDDVAFAHRFTTYPVLENGRVVGLLPFARIARVPRSAWEQTRVRDCMLPRANVPVVREDEALLEALDEMSDSGVRRALVMDDGRLEGLLSMTDVVRLVSWKTAGQP